MFKENTKMQKILQQKGITLVALVITIIVLIILAGISINMLFGENGIIERAKNAKEQTLIAKYKEDIELIKAETRSKYYDGLTLEKLKNAFDDNNKKDWINKTEIINDNEIDKIKLTTNDGYIFYITEDITEYKGKGIVEETPPIISEDITADMVSFTPEDTSWQVDNVKKALDYLYNN